MAEPIRDDFSDNDIGDGDPIQWIARTSSVSFEGPDLRLRNSIGSAAIMQVDERNSTGWSIRARARQEVGDTTGLGMINDTDNTWLSLGPSGRLFVGEEGSNTLGSAETGINARGQDFIVQLDSFDNELRAWAWPVGSVPTTQEPLITVGSPTVANARPAFWVNDFSQGGQGQSVYRWFEYSDEHIAIPEPSSSLLLALSVAILSLARSRRIKREFVLDPK